MDASDLSRRELLIQGGASVALPVSRQIRIA